MLSHSRSRFEHHEHPKRLAKYLPKDLRSPKRIVEHPKHHRAPRRFFWAWVLGTACNIAGALSHSRTQFKQHVDSLNQLIATQNLSPPLAKDLRRSAGVLQGGPLSL